MRRLLLMRHAMAAPSFGGGDYARELTESGAHDATLLGDYLAAQSLIPDLILYSGARRARDTARALLLRWARAIDASEQRSLYDAHWRLILALLHELPDAAPSALLVGHNPGIGDAANHLAGEGDRPCRMRMASNYPTSGLAVIDFEVAAWREIATRSGRLDRFVTPADLARY